MVADKIEKIQLDEQSEIKNAKKLREISDRLNNCLKEMEQSRTNLTKSWKGSSASEYIAKVAKVENEIRLNSKELRMAAEQIDTIVVQMRQAEEKAEDIALHRNCNQ